MASWDLRLQNAGREFDSVLLWLSEESSALKSKCNSAGGVINCGWNSYIII